MIKKLSSISLLGIAFVSLLVSCSSEDIAGVSAEEKINSITKSDTEIFLSSGSSNSTRASIETEGDAGDGSGYFSTSEYAEKGVYMGTFMLASKDKDGNLPIDWSNKKSCDGYTIQNSDFFRNYSVWMFNTRSYAHLVRDEITSEAIATDIRWEDGLCRYYPTGNYHNYDFYGYFPRLDDTRVTAEKDRVYIRNYQLDGTEDVLWGKTLPDGDDDAYSAKYFRKEIHMDGDKAKPAMMKFKHMLSRFMFEITPGSVPLYKEDGKSYAKALATRVKSIRIENVAKEGTFYIADRAGINEGKFVPSNTRSTTPYMLMKSDTEPMDPVFPKLNDLGDAESIPVGQGIIVPSISKEQFLTNPYRLWVTLSIPVNEKGEFLYEGFDPETYTGAYKDIELPSSISLYTYLENTNDFKDGTGLVPGHSYLIQLKIYGPEEIKLAATLENWEPVEGEEIEIH